MNPISAFVASVFRDACTASREEQTRKGGGRLRHRRRRRRGLEGKAPYRELMNKIIETCHQMRPMVSLDVPQNMCSPCSLSESQKICGRIEIIFFV